MYNTVIQIVCKTSAMVIIIDFPIYIYTYVYIYICFLIYTYIYYHPPWWFMINPSPSSARRWGSSVRRSNACCAGAPASFDRCWCSGAIGWSRLGKSSAREVVVWFDDGFPLKPPFSPRDFPSFIVFSHGFPMVFMVFSVDFMVNLMVI